MVCWLFQPNAFWAFNIVVGVCYFGQSRNVLIHYYSRNVAAERLCRLINRLFPAAGARLFPGSPARDALVLRSRGCLIPREFLNISH